MSITSKTLSAVPPLYFNANGQSIDSWSILGNGQQNGTPTPTTPIQPEFVGVRAANLFPLDATKLHIGRIENDGTIDYEVGTITVGTNSVTYQANATWRGFYTDYIQANGNETLTFSPYDSSSISWGCACYDENNNFLGKASAQSTDSTRTFTTLAGTKKVRLNVTSSATEYTITNPILNTGDTALPYEPYGYKIPITNAGQTTPVYLGEVQTVRKIKKLVFDGTENWRLSSDGNIYIALSPNQGVAWIRVLSTHFTSSQIQTNGGLLWFVNADVDFDTVEECKTYLATQYANGTPVTAWYVLATSQTAIVNEPLAKISDYADELSSTNAGISIPTINGVNKLSIDTELQPSNMTIQYTSPNNSKIYAKTDGIIQTKTGSTPISFKSNGTSLVSWNVLGNGEQASSQTYSLTEQPPIDFNADGNPLASWSMLGNGQQSGTPSPDNIIMPTFCGKPVGSDWTIPITCAGQTVPVYLGEVPTVRRVRKLVFDGTENWYVEGNDIFYTNPITDAARYAPICSHYAGVYTLSGNNQVSVSQSLRINIKTNEITHTANDFKAYLAAQYSAGTPVTVWYVLATPETAVVNEPLAKIGAYVDELHSADTTVTIPTQNGSNTLTIDSTLQPSSVTITTASSVYPKNQIMPEFCGVRTGNLCSVSTASSITWEQRQDDILAIINALPVGTYTFSYVATLVSRNDYYDSSLYGVRLYKGSTQWQFLNQWGDAGVGDSLDGSATFEITAETVGQYTAFYLYGCGMNQDGATGSANFSSIMLNIGSTALPHEYYGYKIPISCAEQTNPVYLGQTQTVRKIKKLVLTGEEGWTITSNGVLRIGLSGQLRPSTPLCTHYVGSNATAWSNVPDKSVTVSISGYLAILDTTYTAAADFKSYLAAQYAAGTPVTIWYVLATPQTGIVNEPLCKIESYADELLSTYSEVSIPTIDGQNTLSVETELQPSSMTIQYNSPEYSKVNKIYSNPAATYATYTGKPPVKFISNGNPLSNLSAFGNCIQNGIPTPNNPIMPDGLGDRTANLFDKTNETIGSYMLSDGTIAYTQTYSLTDYIPINGGSSYTISAVTDQGSSAYHCFYTQDKVFISSIQCERTPTTFNTPANAKHIRCSYRIASNLDIMLNTGSTALPYEPYGYKIPITCADQTNNIYLGEKQTLRRINKIVLTGSETCRENLYYFNNAYVVQIPVTSYTHSIQQANNICSHYVYQSGNTLDSGCFGIVFFYLRQSFYIGFSKDGFASVDDFKAFLVNQYNAGTPITVFYGMDHTETEVRNEPLYGLGNYYDEVSVSSSEMTIPTVNGLNTLSFGTTTPPYATKITYDNAGPFPIGKVYARTAGKTVSKTVVPPFAFNSNGDPLISWSIKGNSKQQGTPTPDAPIIPEFVGAKTGNLFDYTNTTGITENSYINQSGAQISDNYYYISYPIQVESNTVYTWTFNDSDNQKHSAPTVGFYDSTNTLISAATHSSNVTYFSFTTPANCAYIKASVYKRNDLQSQAILNVGSTPISYEPYGYKIPITDAEQTVPVYLGEVQTVRKVKKLVLDGTENWQEQRGGFALSVTKKSGIVTTMCTHYGETTGTTDKSIYCRSATSIIIYDSSFSTLTDFKAYLAAQYAAGTPVTVWYALATSQTAIVNEPLCKIGNYVDELRSADANVTIPTIDGENIIHIDTELQPSNMTLQYNTPDYSEIKLDADPSYHDWDAVRQIVRKGLGPKYYPIGYIFYDNFNPETGTAFQVVAYDNHFDPALTAQGYTHSMTLCEVLLDDTITFDATEAFLFTDTEIPAGTYKFTIPNYDASYGGNKTYYFTSTATVPTGSQICISWPYNQTPKTVTAYAGPNPQTNTTAITGFNALTLTEWIDGTSPTATDLGTIAGPTTQAGSSSYGQMNHIHRARYGSNNYLQSGARQFMNSNKASGQWWTPQTVFDRPYGSRNSAGKLTKLRSDFVDVLATPTIQSRTNSYFETTSLDGTTFTLSTNYNIATDKLFLLSPMEVGFNTTDTTVGTLLDYYINATNDARIKKRKSNKTAYYWWLRTPYPSSANCVRYVDTSGALSGHYAVNSYGLVAACIIQ